MSYAAPRELLTFLKALEANNNKEWFDKNRERYDRFYVEPLKELTVIIGAALAKKVKGLHFEPRINGSLFRINRDVRFSKDKRPYKTHAATFLWLGPEKKMQCPGFYLHIEARTVMIGAGIHTFTPDGLDAWRRYIDRSGGKMQQAINRAEKGGFRVDGEKLKRVPRGFDPDHRQAELLKHKGFWVGAEYPATRITDDGATDWVVKELGCSVAVVKLLTTALFGEK